LAELLIKQLPLIEGFISSFDGELLEYFKDKLEMLYIHTSGDND